MEFRASNPHLFPSLSRETGFRLFVNAARVLVNKARAIYARSKSSYETARTLSGANDGNGSDWTRESILSARARHERHKLSGFPAKRPLK